MCAPGTTFPDGRQWMEVACTASGQLNLDLFPCEGERLLYLNIP